MGKEIIRVTKSFTFDMAHALYGYDGPCKNIHGHTYHLYITLRGNVIHDHNNSKNGMVIDFNDLKNIIKRAIIDQFDHALVLNKNSPHYKVEVIKEQFEKVIFLPFQPSCENLIIHFKDLIKPFFEQSVELVYIKLLETPTSYAEWHLKDN